jgi:hypothetical protein
MQGRAVKENEGRFSQYTKIIEIQLITFFHCDSQLNHKNLIRNQQAEGSIPPAGSNKIKVLEN